MSWVAVGAAFVGAAASTYSSNKAASAAKDASRKSTNFAKQQYADWLDVFGDIQANLSEYYENLTPAFIETQGLQAFEQEKDLALKQIEEDFAQRGISSSGLAQDLRKDVAIESATERARIRAEAPLTLAQTQQEFLQIGLGQNPASNVQATLSNRANSAAADARLASSAAASATQNAVEVSFNALSDYLNRDTSSAVDNSGNTVGESSD